MFDNLIYIGKISTTHKLAGCFKVSSRFSKILELINKDIILKKNDDFKIFNIKDVKIQNDKKFLMDLYNINNIEDAKKFINYEIYIRRDLIPDYEEKEDVIGFNVYNYNNYIGKVIDILETAAHEILVVDGDKEILIPYIDVFVKNVDFDESKILVELIEGFL